MSSTLQAFPSREMLTQNDFDRIRKLAFDYCGLDIDHGKEELVASRLGKVMRTLGIPTYGAYYDHVVSDQSGNALVGMIDALTTNHTSFFREQQHFEFLRKEILPALAQRSAIPIWSAACSSGEEPYSVAFAIRDFFPGNTPELHILASDISTRVLEKARAAMYDMAHVENIPRETLQRYFLRGQGEMADFVRVRPGIRNLVDFRRVNLTEPLRGISTQFPLILCRNVMIYFNATTQEQVIAQLSERLEPGGYLFIGHSESLNRVRHSLEYVRPAVYKKAGSLKPGNTRSAA